MFSTAVFLFVAHYEAWLLAESKGGKDSIVSLISATFDGVFHDPRSACGMIANKFRSYLGLTDT